MASRKEKEKSAQDPSSSSSTIPPAPTSRPVVTPLASIPLHLLESLMVHAWQEAKFQVFDLLFLPTVPQLVLYGKGKGSHRLASTSRPLQPPSIPTPRVENGKRPAAKALESTFVLAVVSIPTYLPIVFV